MADKFVKPTDNGKTESLKIKFNTGKKNIISNYSITKELVLWPKQVEDIIED